MPRAIGPHRMRRGTVFFWTFVVGLVGGCDRDAGRATKEAWVLEKTRETNAHLRWHLNAVTDSWYFDGFYGIEFDPETNGAWRWAGKQSTVRMRTSSAPASDPVVLVVHGWGPNEHLDNRAPHLDFFVNGYRVDRFDIPPKTFTHTISIPRRLLGSGEWVDVTVLAANTAKPRGDNRDLGYATTGFLWKRAPE